MIDTTGEWGIGPNYRRKNFTPTVVLRYVSDDVQKTEAVIRVHGLRCALPADWVPGETGMHRCMQR